MNITDFENNWKTLYDTITEDVADTLTEAKQQDTKYYRNVCKVHGPMLFYTKDNSCPVCCKIARDERKRKANTDPELKLYHRSRELLGEIRNRARNAGTEFDLTLEQFRTMYDGSVTACPVLGIPLVYGESGRFSDGSASIDRIDSNFGYIADNVEIISQRANRIKSDGTIEEHLKVALWMLKELDVTAYNKHIRTLTRMIKHIEK